MVERSRWVEGGRPLYARALRLDYLRPSGAACGFFFEGMIAVAMLLSLAELVTWWSVIILPLLVAVLVKVNDMVAGVFADSAISRQLSRARGVARVSVEWHEAPTMIMRLPGVRT